MLCQRRHKDRESAWQELVELLQQWTDELQLKRLSVYGLEESGLDHVVENAFGGSMKTNPIVLEKAEVKAVLMQRL